MAYIHFKALLLALIVVFLVIVINSTIPSTNQPSPNPSFVNKRIPANDTFYEHLSKLIQFKTISYEDASMVDLKQVTAVYKYIETTFPEFWAAMEKTPVGNFSMIFKWKSPDPKSSSHLPILLLSHLDVVPEGTGNWTYPPFKGVITDTEIWGRGALDDKQMLLGIVETITVLLRQNYTPNRDVYITFGFDEEVSGYRGACVVADYFRTQKMKFEFIHDEGVPIVLGIIPGISQPAATVGLTEKGSLDVTVTLSGTSGHSSIPPRNTIIGILAKGIAELEANPVPSKFAGIARLLMETLGPDMSYPLKAVFSNLWLFKPLVLRIFESKPTTNALVSTTTAVTIINGGNKRNVLPATASAHLNFRISPLDSVASVLAHVQKIFLSVDPRFSFQVFDSIEPAPVSPADSPIFKQFATAIRSAFPEALVTPGIMVGNTDTRHFWGLSENIYRFAPNILTKELVDTLHNTNERISKENLVNVINFYNQLILQFTSS